MGATFRAKKWTLLTWAVVGILPFISAQELYVFTEPASNMPSRSISAKISGKWLKGIHSNRLEQRYMPEVMFGVHKNWMLHVGASFSDMYSNRTKWESAKLYAKYRVLSIDEVHRHFRVAAFAELSYSENPVFYDELSLEGDQSGAQAGVILTQLWNKLAVSSTVSYVQVLTGKPESSAANYPYQAVNYSVSGGYLLLPRAYTNFKQTNLNIYAEILGQRAVDLRRYYVDFAPALQLIFNSNAKLNFGYRFQLTGNMHRMAEKSWLVSFERTFLNGLKRRKTDRPVAERDKL